jgi:hypothetical protein
MSAPSPSREGRTFLSRCLPGMNRFCSLGLLASTLAASSIQAADKTWVTTTNQTWTTSAAWSPSGTPLSTDDIVFSTSGSGAILVNTNAVANNLTANTSTAMVFAGTGVNSGRTLTFTGNLTKNGTATALTFRRSTAAPSSLGLVVGGTVFNVGAGAPATTYAINFGTGGNGEQLESFSAGAMSLSGTGAFVNFMVGLTSGSATITGALDMQGATNVVNIRANLLASSTTSGVLQVGSLAGGNANTIIRTNSNATGSTAISTGTLTITGSSGAASFDGIITNGGANGASQFAQNVMAVRKVNGGTQAFTRANGYTGGTSVAGGTLLINNSVGAGGSGVGTGAVVVTGSTSTLGGIGLIATGSNFGTTIGADASLAPGDTGIGSLTFSGSNTTGTVLTLQSTAKIKMELGTAGLAISAPGSSDSLVFLGAASGDVVFNNTDIDFLGTGSAGWYKVFDTDLTTGTTWTGLTLSGQTITSGLNVVNLGGGLTGTLIVGDGTNGDYNDIYLQVVPEPTTVLMFGLGATLMLARLRRRA